MIWKQRECKMPNRYIYVHFVLPLLYSLVFTLIKHFVLNLLNTLQALLSGCSAGGLAVILRCDEFSNLFSRTTKVKCLSDAGLFLDT